MALFPDTFPAILKYSDLKLTVIAMTGPNDNWEPSDSQQPAGQCKIVKYPIDLNPWISILLWQ